MSEEKVTEFRDRAEAGVGLPDLDALERRGAAMRRRRIAGAAAAVVIATVGVGVGVLRLPGSEQGAPDVVDEPSVDAVLFADGALLEPGVGAYDEFKLSTGAFVRVELTPPDEGWYVHLGGPQRGVNLDLDKAGDQWAGLLWYEAKGVYERPCGDTPMRSRRFEPLTDSLAPLVQKPWTSRVVEAPEAEMLGGYEAEHAVLRLDQCDGDHPSPIVTGGEVGPLPGGDVFDIWLVPLPEARTSIVVFDPTGEGRGAIREEWRQVVDSLEISVDPTP